MARVWYGGPTAGSQSVTSSQFSGSPPERSAGSPEALGRLSGGSLEAPQSSPEAPRNSPKLSRTPWSSPRAPGSPPEISRALHGSITERDNHPKLAMALAVASL
eukprot:3026123-Alexandrium_andersonii.AAC.1